MLNSGERIRRRLCRGVSERDTKKFLDGIGFLVGSFARSFNSGERIRPRLNRRLCRGEFQFLKME